MTTNQEPVKFVLYVCRRGHKRTEKLNKCPECHIEYMAAYNKAKYAELCKDPEKKKQRNKEKIAWHVKKYHSDSAYKKKMIQKTLASKKRRIEREPEYREKINQAARDYWQRKKKRREEEERRHAKDVALRALEKVRRQKNLGNPDAYGIIRVAYS